MALVSKPNFDNETSVTTLVVKIKDGEANIEAYHMPDDEEGFDDFVRAMIDFMDLLGDKILKRRGLK